METGHSCVEEESHRRGGSLIKQGISLVSNPWHRASKAVLCIRGGYPCFPRSQVIQSVDADVIVLVRDEKRRVVDEGAEREREPGARGPATPGGGGRGGSSPLGPGMNLYRSKNAAQFLLTHPLHFASGS